jgi:hypothetical protein
VASTLAYFMLPEDERALFRHLARHGLTAYPELVPPGFAAPRVDEALAAAMEWTACYLAAERLGPVIVHPLKRGPDRGMLVVEAVPSPVLHYERSLRNEEGEIVSGRLWAELDVNDDPGSRKGKPLALRQIFEDVHQLFRKSWRRSDPKGFWVGPHAGNAWKRGDLRLREAGHKGGLIGVWR